MADEQTPVPSPTPVPEEQAIKDLVNKLDNSSSLPTLTIGQAFLEHFGIWPQSHEELARKLNRPQKRTFITQSIWLASLPVEEKKQYEGKILSERAIRKLKESRSVNGDSPGVNQPVNAKNRVNEAVNGDSPGVNQSVNAKNRVNEAVNGDSLGVNQPVNAKKRVNEAVNGNQPATSGNQRQPATARGCRRASLFCGAFWDFSLGYWPSSSGLSVSGDTRLFFNMKSRQEPIWKAKAAQRSR